VLRDLRSIADLYAAVDASRGQVSLRVLRGAEELTVTVALDGVTVSAATTGRGARDEHVV